MQHSQQLRQQLSVQHVNGLAEIVGSVAIIAVVDMLNRHPRSQVLDRSINQLVERCK